MYKNSSFAILVFWLFLSPGFGQTNQQIEKELVTHAKNIQKWSGYSEESNSELLEKENAVFRQKLLKYASTRPATIRYKFSELDEFIDIATSPDKRFRIYSWDTGTGGTMHFFDNVYQFIGRDDKIYAKGNEYQEGESIGAFFTDIFEVNTKSGKVYLTVSQSILSTSYKGQSIGLFKINGKTLDEDIKLIKTRSGIRNSVGFSYDFFSVVDRAERPVKLVHYNQKTKTFKFPVVIENEKFPQGEVTGRWIKYRFNGRYFVKVK
jgi:hypothetical protein